MLSQTPVPVSKIDTEFLKFIIDSYQERKASNPRYSIRAYAKHLNVDQSTLSKVMKGTTNLSFDSTRNCLEILKAPQDLKSKVLQSYKKKTRHFLSIEDEVFEVISNWCHFAILELATVKNVKITPKVVAQKFNITEEEASEAIERLISFGFFNESEDGLTIGRPNNSWLNFNSTSEARALLQKQWLHMSIKALEEVPFDLREHSSVTLAVNKKHLPEFKRMFKEMRGKMIELLQKDEEFDEVYQLTLNFFPLTEISRES